jgi:hypothetical protein
MRDKNRHPRKPKPLEIPDETQLDKSLINLDKSETEFGNFTTAKIVKP